VAAHSLGSTDRYRCSNLFSIPDCSAQISTRYVTFIGWLWRSGTVERQASYIVLRVDLHV